MKVISKDKVEFDVIVRMVSPIVTSEDDAEQVEACIHYFDRESELNLVIKGKYTNKFMKYLSDASLKMKTLRLVVTVKDFKDIKIVK